MVTSTVTAFLPLAGDHDALLAAFNDDPQTWLPSARRDGAAWALPVHAGALSRTVVTTVGDPWRVGTTTWRTLSWDPVHEEHDPTRIDRLLPSLDGELALDLDGPRATLVFEARYQPPGGALGAAADAVALHRVARRTVERLLADIAARLVSRASTDAPGASAGVS